MRLNILFVFVIVGVLFSAIFSGCALHFGRVPHASFQAMITIRCYPCVTFNNESVGIGIITNRYCKTGICLGYRLK